VLVVPPIIVTGLLLGGLGSDSIQTTLGFAVSGLVGGTAYAIGFTALGVVTGRALLIGLGYTLIWEASLAGLLEGTRFLSVRQATLGVATALTGDDVGSDPLGIGTVQRDPPHRDGGWARGDRRALRGSSLRAAD
jgi:hypothetical protein